MHDTINPPLYLFFGNWSLFPALTSLGSFLYLQSASISCPLCYYYTVVLVLDDHESQILDIGLPNLLHSKRSLGWDLLMIIQLSLEAWSVHTHATLPRGIPRFYWVVILKGGYVSLYPQLTEKHTAKNERSSICDLFLYWIPVVGTEQIDETLPWSEGN